MKGYQNVCCHEILSGPPHVVPSAESDGEQGLPGPVPASPDCSGLCGSQSRNDARRMRVHVPPLFSRFPHHSLPSLFPSCRPRFFFFSFRAPRGPPEPWSSPTKVQGVWVWRRRGLSISLLGFLSFSCPSPGSFLSVLAPSCRMKLPRRRSTGSPCFELCLSISIWAVCPPRGRPSPYKLALAVLLQLYLVPPGGLLVPPFDIQARSPLSIPKLVPSSLLLSAAVWKQSKAQCHTVCCVLCEM